jgi:DNA polymerase-3 subunit gamma/tau
MSYVVLARKYRPQSFDQVVAQGHVTQTLMNAVAADRLAHAILFTGPRGTGKTTIARILAKSMNCQQGPTPIPCNTCQSCLEIAAGSAADVFEIDGASNNGVEQVREIRENIKYMPARSAFKIYIIDEVHMLSTAAFNALLKTLEEPPAHVLFLFATTEPKKIPVTILSRCQRYDLKRIEAAAINESLVMICQKEKIDIESKSLALIAREADGSMRDALSLLDQATAGLDGQLDHAQILEVLGVVDRQIVFDLTDAIFKADAVRVLDLINRVYHSGHHIPDLYIRFIEHMRNLLVWKLSPDYKGLTELSSQEMEIIKQQAEPVPPLHLHQILDVLFSAEQSLKYSAQPRMAFEVVMIKLLNIRPALPIDDLIKRIDGLQKQFSSGPGLEFSTEGQSIESAGSIPPEENPAAERRSSTEVESKPSKSEEVPPPTGDEAWQAILGIISERYPSLAPNLSHSKIIRQSDDRIEIEVNGSGFNYQRMRTSENIKVLEEIAGTFFGRRMNVVVHPGTNKTSLPQKDKIAAANRLKQELLHHPLVADAIEIFNGKLVDIKTG